MKKLLWAVLVLIWCGALLILIFALTDFGLDQPFTDHKFIIGIGFVTLTGFMRILYCKSKRGKTVEKKYTTINDKSNAV